VLFELDILELLTNEETYEDDLMERPKKMKMPSHKNQHPFNSNIVIDNLAHLIQMIMVTPVRSMTSTKK